MKVSFVIPSFQSVTWLPHAVQSCLEQSHKDIEVIIVDDGSTDKTPEYLNWIAKNPLVKVLINEENRGRSFSRNAGNKHASGDIICVLDADDISTPNRAELMTRFFKRRVDYVFGGCTVIDAIGSPQHLIMPGVFNRDRVLKEKTTGIVHSTAAYTPEFAKEFPYQDGDISKLGIDDWYQQTQGIMAGKVFDSTTQRLGCHRILSSQITRTRDENAVKELKEKLLTELIVPA